MKALSLLTTRKSRPGKVPWARLASTAGQMTGTKGASARMEMRASGCAATRKVGPAADRTRSTGKTDNGSASDEGPGQSFRSRGATFRYAPTVEKPRAAHACAHYRLEAIPELTGA
jgi:hypothetical protein